MRARPIGYTDDGRRIFSSLDIALYAAQRTAEVHGSWSGVVRVNDGWAMKYDPLAYLEIS